MKKIILTGLVLSLFAAASVYAIWPFGSSALKSITIKNEAKDPKTQALLPLTLNLYKDDKKTKILSETIGGSTSKTIDLTKISGYTKGNSYKDAKYYSLQAAGTAKQCDDMFGRSSCQIGTGIQPLKQSTITVTDSSKSTGLGTSYALSVK